MQEAKVHRVLGLLQVDIVLQAGENLFVKIGIFFPLKHRRARKLEAVFLFVRSFSGLFRAGKKKKSFALGYLSGATHTLPVRLPAWFVLLSTHKLMQSFNRINAPFPGFATNFH